MAYTEVASFFYRHRGLEMQFWSDMVTPQKSPNHTKPGPGSIGLWGRTDLPINKNNLNKNETLRFKIFCRKILNIWLFLTISNGKILKIARGIDL